MVASGEPQYAPVPVSVPAQAVAGQPIMATAQPQQPQFQVQAQAAEPQQPQMVQVSHKLGGRGEEGDERKARGCLEARGGGLNVEMQRNLTASQQHHGQQHQPPSSTLTTTLIITPPQGQVVQAAPQPQPSAPVMAVSATEVKAQQAPVSAANPF